MIAPELRGARPVREGFASPAAGNALLLFAKKTFRAAPAALAARLHDLVRQPPLTLGMAREWLVAAGQIEQAVADTGAGGDAPLLTDRAAHVFLALLAGEDAGLSRHALLGALAENGLSGTAVDVRIPEGFAWYGLYPDSHARTAARWAALHPGASVTVIGLRSIGTTLGAVVAAALRRSGLAVAPRRTVRPHGSPFARQSVIDPVPDRQGFAIVVDEGPGLSGSSMASVAEALAAGGIAPERIVFFPGHGNGPGDRRGAREARWWTAERCWLSPAPCPPDQRPGWDWVFGGFAAAAPDLSTLAGIKQARQRRLAAEGLALPSPAAVEGWIALHGAGCPLTRDDLSADVLRGTLAPYVSRAALPVPDETVSAGAIDRIAAALAACGLEGCGAENRARAQCRALPLAGDGRMAPGEWLRLADGRVMKRNAMGSDCEHDWAGAQSLLWDVAGAMVEWDMDADAIPVMRGVDAEAVAFHEAGYCCLGLAKAQHAGDEAAARRCGVALRSAAARMRVST